MTPEQIIVALYRHCKHTLFCIQELNNSVLLFIFFKRGGGVFGLGWDWVQVEMEKEHDTIFIQRTDI